MKNKKLISYSGVVHPETGEQISSIEREIQLPRAVKFPKNFTKIHDKARRLINKKDLGKFIILTFYLEYETNRLVFRNVGKKPVPLKYKDFSLILNQTPRSISSLMNNLRRCLAILKMDTFYYVNPTFASRSQSILTEEVLKMIKIDPSITLGINEKQKIIIRNFIKLDLINNS